MELCLILEKAFFAYNFGQFCFARNSVVFRPIQAKILSNDCEKVVKNAQTLKNLSF